MIENYPLPLVSVIMPTFNKANWISKSIKSVINQTFQNWELIIWDDGSSDGTVEIVKNFKTANIKYYFTKENNGVASARNQAIKVSQGTYLAFLDSDDEWAEQKLELQLGILQENPRIDFIFSDFLNRNLSTGKEDSWFKLKKNGLENLKVQNINENVFIISGGMPESLLISNFIATDTVMISKKIFNDVGFFNENLRNSEDIELWWRFGLVGAKFAFVDEILLIRNWLPTGLSRMSVSSCKNEIERINFCYLLAKENKRKDLYPFLKHAYQKAWRNLIQQYGQIKAINAVLISYFHSLKYGISLQTFFAFLKVIFSLAN